MHTRLRSKLHTLGVVISLFAAVVIMLPAPVQAGVEDDLREVQEKLEELRKKKEGINNNINSEKEKSNQYTSELYSLKNKIDLLGTEIEEKELTIEELQLQIAILEENIIAAKSQIEQAESEVAKLQGETDERLVDMYISQKMFSNLDLFVNAEGTDVIKIDLYQNALQQQTNTMLEELDLKKAQLAEQKLKLEEDKVQVERDEVQIQEEKIALEKDKEEIDQQRAIYYRKRNESLAKIDSQEDQLALVTEEEQMALAEQRRLEQIVFDRVNSIPNGAYVTRGTIIGAQGCTGYCTGPHLHFGTVLNGVYQNPCSLIPAGSLGGCGGGNGTISFPMSGSYVLTSGYGWRWGKFHYGLDIANYNSSAPIYAAHDGYMISGFEPCSSSNPLCKNGGANYKIICQNKNNCNNGLKTLYWHLR